MSLKLVSPYLKKGVWLKGNLHVHSNLSDGRRAPQEVIDAYSKLGYDVLAVTDHNKLCPYDDLDARGMILIPGYENGHEIPHIQHLNTSKVCEVHDDRQKTIDFINADGGFAVLNHPNWWREFNHISIRNMLLWENYHGMEITNSLARWQYGNHMATDKWDQILSAGRNVFGFGNDDSHGPNRDGETFNMFLARKKTFSGVIEAIRRGSFYVSTGVVISNIAATPKTVTVKTKNAERIAVVSRLGRRIAQTDGRALTFHFADDSRVEGYFRFECYGSRESSAWTQAFWVKQ
jgi:hypothetical protein